MSQSGSVADPTINIDTIKFEPETKSYEEGLLFYDETTKTLKFYNDEPDVALDIGEESRIRVCNNTGSTIDNGSICYISGSDAGCPEVTLAQANSISSSYVIGVATHDIEDGTTGYITTFGLVRGLNTSAFSGGEIIYLSTTVAGGVTLTKPDNSDWVVRIGYIGAADSSAGTFLVNVENSGNIEDIHGYDNVTNGLLEPSSNAQMSFDNGTRTLTIEPQATSFSYWSEGKRYDVTSSDTIQIDDTEGLHYIYYDGDTLTKTTTWSDDIITKYAIIAIIYWDATNSKQLYLGDEYLHTIKMGPLTHEYLHETVGFALQSGGALTDITTDQDGSLDAHAQFGNGATTAWDEDAEFTHTARTSTSNITVYYKSGAEASFVWRTDETASFPVLTAGTGRAAYNQLTGGNWVQTELTNNDFVLAHVFTYNDSTRKFAVIQGENEYGNLNDARDGAETEIINITTAGLPTAEIKFLGTVILQSSNTYTNTVKSRIVSTDTGADYIDLRLGSFIIGGTSGGTSDHSLLANLDEDTHTQYVLADGTRAMEEITVDNSSIIISNSDWNFKQAYVQTTNDTVTAIDTIALDTNELVTVEARINGFKSDYSASCGGFIKYCARRAGAGAIEVSAPLTDILEDSAGSPTVDSDVDGNNIRLLVRGVAAETWSWVVSYNYHYTKV